LCGYIQKLIALDQKLRFSDEPHVLLMTIL